MKSKKRLFAFLQERFPQKPDIGLEKYSIDDETYGPQSMIYFFNIKKEWKMSRKAFEGMLEDAGFKVDRSYWPGADATEVQVSYFKGYHWDE